MILSLMMSKGIEIEKNEKAEKSLNDKRTHDKLDEVDFSDGGKR